MAIQQPPHFKLHPHQVYHSPRTRAEGPKSYNFGAESPQEAPGSTSQAGQPHTASTAEGRGIWTAGGEGGLGGTDGEKTIAQEFASSSAWCSRK